MGETFSGLFNQHERFISTAGGKILFTIIVIFVSGILMAISRRIIRQTTTGKLKFDETLAAILKIVIQYGIVIIAAIIILDAFGVNTTSLIALLGAAGVAIGLALKDTLSNIAAGIILLILRTYRLGDFIEFGAYSGSVREINLFTTILETPDGIYISAPNSSIWGTPLKNYTRNQKRRLDLTIRVSLTDSLDTAFRTLREIAAAETRFLQDPPPQAMVQSLGDSSVNLMLRAWARSDQYWAIYWDQMRNLMEKFEEAGLKIPLPQTHIRFVPDAPKPFEPGSKLG